MTDVLSRSRPALLHVPVDERRTLLPMLEGLSRALGYSRALVALYDADRQLLRGTVGLNVRDPLAEALEVPLTAAGSPLVVALLEGRPIRVDDAATDARLRESNAALLVEMGIRAFVVAPLRGTSELPDLVGQHNGPSPIATWKGREIPAVGVVILSKDDPITDLDIDRLMPFVTQAGTAIARAGDVERLLDSTEQLAIESEWLWWMVSGVQDPVVLTDDRNEILLHNLRAESLFKTSPDDSEGKRRAISMNNFLFSAALSTASLEPDGRPGSRDLTLVDPIEGTELLFEVISAPATNYRNGARGIASVLKDVTDLRHAAEELTENVQRLQSADEEIRLERDRLNLVLRSVPNPIIVMDNDNQIITMNQEALRLFESTPARAATSRRNQICASNDAKFTSFVAQLRLDTSKVKRGELALTDPDTDELMAMEVNSTEITDELGAVAATVSVMQDVSRLRELERRRVEQILFESEKLAATGRLAASIAHEINNPLEAIKNSLYLLSQAIDDESPHRKFLKIAVDETARVSRILRQMLGFYRPGKMEPTDVNAVIQEAAALMERHLRQQRVRVDLDLSPTLPAVVASADQLKQVILNLLVNAQQAMPEGGTISIATHQSRDADPELVGAEAIQVRVRDTGSGIPSEHLPHIFEPFFSTKEMKGTGLGLWVSYGIVQSHGGSIHVRSRAGRGTTFTISLPIGGTSRDDAG